MVTVRVVTYSCVLSERSSRHWKTWRRSVLCIAFTVSATREVTRAYVIAGKLQQQQQQQQQQQAVVVMPGSPSRWNPLRCWSVTSTAGNPPLLSTVGITHGRRTIRSEIASVVERHRTGTTTTTLPKAHAIPLIPTIPIPMSIVSPAPVRRRPFDWITTRFRICLRIFLG